jgi:hypothetical protein
MSGRSRSPEGYLGEHFSIHQIVPELWLCAAFYQEDVKVGGDWFGVELPHHQSNLPAMVGGVICNVLHQMSQTRVGCAKREHSVQPFICHLLHKRNLLSFDFPLFRFHSSDGRI